MSLRHLASGVAVLILLGGVLLIWPAQAPEFVSVRSSFTPSDAFLLDRDGDVIDTLRIDMKVRRFEWQPLDAISPAFIAAVVRGEDARFWDHHGIDWRSVIGAARDRYLRGRHRGASTITMQLASLLRASPRTREGARAWWQKRNQIRLARALESSWTKEQILEAYLNLLHYRGELQGIAAASYVLAGKVPSGLSLSESLVVAALLPQPSATPERVAARACSRDLFSKGVRDLKGALSVRSIRPISSAGQDVSYWLATFTMHLTFKPDGGSAQS